MWVFIIFHVLSYTLRVKEINKSQIGQGIVIFVNFVRGE